MFDIPYTIFRICVPYGNLHNKNYSYGTIGFFLSKAEKGEDITIYGDGEIKRTFTYIRDIYTQIYKCIIHTESINNTYNIGGETFTLKDIAEKIAQRYNVKIKSIDWKEDDLKIESGDTFFDDTKISNLTGDVFTMEFSSFKWLK
jgi:UDP-glucose 4-epimerase